MNKATVALWAILAATVASASCTDSDPVLSPAPSPPGPLGYCPFGMVRAERISTGSLVRVMADHLPDWLPDGMGLVQGYGPEGPGEFGSALFADARCREIDLRRSTSSDLGSGQRVGPWTVAAGGPDSCGNMILGPAQCISYRTVVEGGSLSIQMMGIPRSDGDRIVGSIPL